MPPLLRELTPEQWALWKRHPVTALVMERYLPDFRRSMEQQVLHNWLDGHLTLQLEQQARGYILGAYLIEALSLQQVMGFYEEQTGAPVASAGGRRA